MENEYYYRNELEKNMQSFLDKETKKENEFGWIDNNLAKRMADASFAVLQTSVELNEFLKREDILH